MVLLGHGGLHAVANDLPIRRLLEEDQCPDRDLTDEDDNQEDEELEGENRFLFTFPFF